MRSDGQSPLSPPVAAAAGQVPNRGTIRVIAGRSAAFPSPEPDAVNRFDPRQTQGHEEPAPRLEVGMQLGDVTIKSLLARGGVCEIYRGEIPLLRQEVAVKVLNFRFKERDDVIQRFQKEAAKADRVDSWVLRGRWRRRMHSEVETCGDASLHAQRAAESWDDALLARDERGHEEARRC